MKAPVVAQTTGEMPTELTPRVLCSIRRPILSDKCHTNPISDVKMHRMSVGKVADHGTDTVIFPVRFIVIDCTTPHLYFSYILESTGSNHSRGTCLYIADSMGHMCRQIWFCANDVTSCAVACKVAGRLRLIDQQWRPTMRL